MLSHRPFHQPALASLACLAVVAAGAACASPPPSAAVEIMQSPGPDAGTADAGHARDAEVDAREDGGDVSDGGDAGDADAGEDGASAGEGGTLVLSGRFIRDGTGDVFVPRGPELVGGGEVGVIDEIADTGANALRLLLVLDAVNGYTPEQFDATIGRAVERGMVVWLSLFTWNDDDNRRIGDVLGGGNLQGMDDYLPIWERDWLFNLVQKYDGHIIVDALQEYVPPAGVDNESEEGRQVWASAAIANIQGLRARGYTQPLEVMSNYEGRDLYAIVERQAEIRAADSHRVEGQPQTMFGWQAYWEDGFQFYYEWQGGLLRGEPTTAAEAVELFVATADYPIQVGLLHGYDMVGDALLTEVMPQCAAHDVGWLWWAWDDLADPALDAVVTSEAGFAGAVPSN